MHSLKSNYDLKLDSLTYIEWANTAGCNVVNGEKERWRYCIGGGGNAHL